MLKKSIKLYIDEAIQVVAAKYINKYQDNTIEKINDATPDELASSISDELSVYFGRDNWMDLENEVYDIIVYNDENNIQKIKNLLIATVEVLNLFK